MSGQFLIQVLEGSTARFTATFSETVELGRQIRDQNEKVFTSRYDKRTNTLRVAIASADDHTRFSRVHVRLSPLTTGRVRIENASTKVLPIRLADGTELNAGEVRDVSLPDSFTVGGRTIALAVPPPPPGPDEPSRFPGQGLLDPSRFPAEALAAGTRIEVERVLGWLKSTMAVLQSAANSSDFFQSAAQAVVDVIGLDSGRVILWTPDGWKTEACRLARDVPPGAANWEPSRGLLNKVRADRQTIWWDVAAGDTPPTHAGITLVAAAPILNRQGEVLGALYGDRRREDEAMSAVPVRRLEAVLLEILAGSVAAGLARVEQEKATLTAHAKFEQFFTPELARQLAARPALLQSRQVEVTVLVCEVRGFGSTAEWFGPASTENWIGDVLGTLSKCVLDQQGVLVDYTDDRLLTMWGAPEEIIDHPARAVRAALDMLARLADLNARWQPVLNEPVRIGVGLSTGVALVGNVGSQYKFKYGPLGNTVSLAARMQELTRDWGCPVLATGTTRNRAAPELQARRLGTVAISGVADAVDLYELAPPNRPGWEQLVRDYENALEKFETGALRDAALGLTAILATYPDDVPALKLLTRVVEKTLAAARK